MRIEATGSGTCQCGADFKAGAAISVEEGQILGCPACMAGDQDFGAKPTRRPPITRPSAAEAQGNFDKLMARLDAEQRVVASWTPGQGNVRVIASAGSGKTTTAVALAARLLRGRLISPRDVILTTFTNKAGRELRERLAVVLPPEIPVENGPFRVGTFHSIALSSLRTSSIRVPRSGGRWDHARNLDRKREEDETVREDFPRSQNIWYAVLGWSDVPGLGYQKGLDIEKAESKSYAQHADIIRANGLLLGSPEAREAAAKVDLDRFPEAWALYERSKQALGGWDFADALESFHLGLKAGTLVDRARLVIVDEAQDNSFVQLEIATLLARSGGEVILVGDSRQAIYEWRGAAPEFFHEADQRIGAKTLQIRSNYRSGRKIVALGNAVAIGKAWSLGDAATARRDLDGTITVFGSADPSDEAEKIATEVETLLHNGEKPDEIALLTRTNAQAGPLEAALTARKIPVVVVGGYPFFKRGEVRASLAALVLSQQDDVESLDRIVNKPHKRYLGKVWVAQVGSFLGSGRDLPAAMEATIPRLKRTQPAGVRELVEFIRDLRTKPWKAAKEGEETVAEFAANFLSPSDEGKDDENDNERAGYAWALARIAEHFASVQELAEFASRSIAEVIGTWGSADEVSKEDLKGRVTISTVHRAKGLEWKHLFVLASEGVFPHSRSMNDERRMMEEERLFYVAVTRAKDNLWLSWSSVNLYEKPAGPSQFLDYVEKIGMEIPDRAGVVEPVLTPERIWALFDEIEPTVPYYQQAVEMTAEQVGLSVVAVEDFLAQRPRVQVQAAPVPILSVVPPIPIPILDEAALPVAHTLAVARGKTTVAEQAGGRYVRVTEQDFAELLGPLGFERAATDREVRARQIVYTAGVKGTDRQVRIYSSIPTAGEEARVRAADSIKVALIKTLPDGSERAAAGKQDRVYRTRNWRAAVLDRIEELLPIARGG